MKNKLRQQGFTLIELLVVVVIIGILASVAIPNFAGAQDKAKNSAVQANAHTVQLALEQYGVDNTGQYPQTITGTTASNVVGNTAYLAAYPKTPWNQQQAADIALPSGLTNQAMNVAFTTADGSGTAAPSATTHFGGILYVRSGTANDQYVLGAVGKYSKNPGLVLRVTNQ
jgi:general secretion pathway protein G